MPSSAATPKRAHRPVAVRHFMTAAPRTIEAGERLEEAHRIMRAHRVRHLPVLRGGKLVGIVSQRDLLLVESLADVDPAEVPVEDAMREDTYVVTPLTPIAKVAMEMADRKLGSAIVVDSGQVVGVFTVTDACRALARLVGGGPAPKSARGRSK